MLIKSVTDLKFQGHTGLKQTNVSQIVFNLPVYLKQSVVHLPEFNEYITLAHTRFRDSGDLDIFSRSHHVLNCLPET